MRLSKESLLDRTMLQFLEETLPWGQCRLSLNIFVSAYIFVRLTISWHFTRWARRKEREPVYVLYTRAESLWMKSDQSHAIRKFMRESPFLASMTVSISLCIDRTHMLRCVAPRDGRLYCFKRIFYPENSYSCECVLQNI